MALVKKISFSGGELDPVLHDKVNLEKFATGLHTGRNCLSLKTSRVTSRMAFKFSIESKLDDREVVIFSQRNEKYIFEFGHEYIRIHNTDTDSYDEVVSHYLEEDLPYLQFTPCRRKNSIDDKNYRSLFIWYEGQDAYELIYQSDSTAYTPPELNATSLTIFDYGAAGTITTATGTGESYEYAFSFVSQDGYESLPITISGTAQLPIVAGNETIIDLECDPVALSPLRPKEFKVYRRPVAGGAYGYVGSTSDIGTTGAGLTLRYIASFVDYGFEADYLQRGVEAKISEVNDYTTGIIYQGRLVIGRDQIFASRTSNPNNFTADTPLSDDSALAFKAGLNNAKVLRFTDNGALVAHTDNGIYSNLNGPLVPSNTAMSKRGDWVIDPALEPITAPGLFAIVDLSTNSILDLNYANENDKYVAGELTIFSDHLFREKTIVSWSYLPGITPLVFTVFDDGTFATMTYQRDQDYVAWTRHDTLGEVEQVSSVRSELTGEYKLFAVIQREGTKKCIEYTCPRFVRDHKDLVCVDSAVTANTTVHGEGGVDADTLSFTTVSGDLWEGAIRIQCTTGIFGAGYVGQTLRMFDENDSAYDLLVTEFVDTKAIIATPDREIPEDLREEFILYRTYDEVTGLDHLEGQNVSIQIDGSVEASPNNTVDSYKKYTVIDGTVTLPRLGAFIHIGLPFVVDIGTLNIDTPNGNITVDAKTVPRVWVRTYNSKGFYAGSTFPDDDTNDGMKYAEYLRNESDHDRASLQPQIKRHEVAIPNDWNSNGKVCIREVDPVGLEILSIIPDVIIP